LCCLFVCFAQVINAALALSARPKSQVVKNNMEMYRSIWENHVHVLTEAVDDITSIDDFLAVSGMIAVRIRLFFYALQKVFIGELLFNWR